MSPHFIAYRLFGVSLNRRTDALLYRLMVNRQRYAEGYFKKVFEIRKDYPVLQPFLRDAFRHGMSGDGEERRFYYARSGNQRAKPYAGEDEGVVALSDVIKTAFYGNGRFRRQGFAELGKEDPLSYDD